jgi:hypothetical protein
MAHTFRADRRNTRRLAEELRPLPASGASGAGYVEDDTSRPLYGAFTLPKRRAKLVRADRKIDVLSYVVSHTPGILAH